MYSRLTNPILYIIVFAITLFSVFACSAENPFVHADGSKIVFAEKEMVMRGAALMDDSTLWFQKSTNPNMNSIEERDYAFTALGDLNTVRLAVKMDYFIDAQGKAKEAGFAFVDKQLALAKRHDLFVILDMHIPNGGGIQDFKITKQSQLFWNSSSMQDTFVKGWGLIANRYKDDAGIAAYELMNEPTGTADQYWRLMDRVVAEIRKSDRRHMLIVQAMKDGTVRKLRDGNVAYSFHFYEPLWFTHQNVTWDKRFATDAPCGYPGKCTDGNKVKKMYDSKEIDRSINRMVSAAKGYKVPFILGEFAVSTAAPEKSKLEWIRDVINSTEKQGFNGYIYWRQIGSGKKDLSQKEFGSMAIINKGDYFSPAQFFGIRPMFKAFHPNYDAKSFYLNYGVAGEKEK